MKPLLILILSLLFALSAMGQQPESSDSGFTNKTEAKNQFVNKLKEGKWIEYVDIGGFIADTSFFKDSSSLNYMLTIYHEGKPTGIRRLYYNTGTIWIECYYINGMGNGVTKKYDSYGRLFLETPYVNDSANGVQKRYYPNGKIFYEIPYKNNVGGVPQYYKDDGTPMPKGTYSVDENGNEIKQ